MPLLMHRGAQMKLLLPQRAPRAASREDSSSLLDSYVKENLDRQGEWLWNG